MTFLPLLLLALAILTWLAFLLRLERAAKQQHGLVNSRLHEELEMQGRISRKLGSELEQLSESSNNLQKRLEKLSLDLQTIETGPDQRNSIPMLKLFLQQMLQNIKAHANIYKQ